VSYILHSKVSSYSTEQDLAETFSKWGVRDWEASYNVMRSRHGNINLSVVERQATVQWVDPRTKREVTLTMNRQRTVNDNIRVLYLAIEAIRLNEKRGIDETVRAAYLQLAPAGNHWTNVLELPATASAVEVEQAFKKLARKAHPDVGGTDEEMAALNAARAAALSEVE
jgi:hypothetical protein